MQDVVQLCSFLLQSVLDAKGLHGLKKITVKDLDSFFSCEFVQDHQL